MGRVLLWDRLRLLAAIAASAALTLSPLRAAGATRMALIFRAILVALHLLPNTREQAAANAGVSLNFHFHNHVVDHLTLLKL